MNGNGSLKRGQDELSAIRKILERSRTESSHAHAEIEAILSELRSLKNARFTSAPTKAP
jgi:hypothetical protein